jgi:hypothetical protein
MKKSLTEQQADEALQGRERSASFLSAELSGRASAVDEVIFLEWEMFSSVSNMGGKAGCQFERATFEVMRRSQIGNWPEKLLASYRNDLLLAARQGRNLMSEKYARMMESTWPEEYAALADELPAVEEETLARIENIVGINVEWKKAACARYPVLGGKGRPVSSNEDSRSDTSFETYLRAELKTYSPKTLRLLHEHTRAQQHAGQNGVEGTLLMQARLYGYASLEEAEQAENQQS